MKTITVKGKVYEVGKLYKFSDSNSNWYVERLIRICDRGFFVAYCEGSNEESSWRVCRVITEGLGTIKDAPIELERGEWYMCSDSNGVKRVGYFDGAVMTDGLNHFGDSCLNPLRRDTYTPLYKMVKAYAVGVECENYKQI